MSGKQLPTEIQIRDRAHVSTDNLYKKHYFNFLQTKRSISNKKQHLEVKISLAAAVSGEELRRIHRITSNIKDVFCAVCLQSEIRGGDKLPNYNYSLMRRYHYDLVKG